MCTCVEARGQRQVSSSIAPLYLKQSQQRERIHLAAPAGRQHFRLSLSLPRS